MTDPGPLWTLKEPLSRTGLVLRLFGRFDRIEGTHEGLRLDVDRKRLAIPYQEIHQVKTETVRRSAGFFWGPVFFATAIVFLGLAGFVLPAYPGGALVFAIGASLQAFYAWVALVGVDECHITIETIGGEKHRFIADPDEAERYLVGLLE